MAEHEPPADLLDKLAQAHRSAIWGNQSPTGWMLHTSDVAARTFLAALAEWADGNLIDPSTWTRVTAERKSTWHYAEHNGEPWCDHPSSDGCSSPDLGERIPLYTLDPPLTREDP